jgi:hypothetical protein
MLARERGLGWVPEWAACRVIASLSESATREEADPLSMLVVEVALFSADRRAHGR